MAGALFLGYYVRTYDVPIKEVFIFTPSEIRALKRKIGRVKSRLGR